MFVFKMKTLNGTPSYAPLDFDIVNKWLRENGINKWERRFLRGFHGSVVACFSFHDVTDAALFKLFWNDDLEPSD